MHCHFHTAVRAGGLAHAFSSFGGFGNGNQYRAVPSCHMWLFCVVNSVAQYHTPGWLACRHKTITGVPSFGSLSLTLIHPVFFCVLLQHVGGSAAQLVYVGYFSVRVIYIIFVNFHPIWAFFVAFVKRTIIFARKASQRLYNFLTRHPRSPPTEIPAESPRPSGREGFLS